MSTVLKTAPKNTNTTGPVYLDCNATTPVEPRVFQQVAAFMTEEYGNSGSRTHEFGNRAKVAVQHARDQVASLVGCQREEVIFTSGATESNNIALLGLLEHGEKVGRKHIVTTAIEHKAVLEPLEAASKRGFKVSIVPPEPDGAVSAQRIAAELRTDTLLVSVMHVNNETGVLQPISAIAKAMDASPAFLHVDAAQGFGKRSADLRNPRIDLVSVSGHKIYAPKGIGSLIMRRRGFEKAPLSPLMYGGGQERGIRPGTLPVPLIVGLGEASEIAQAEWQERESRTVEIRKTALAALMSVGGIPNGSDVKALSTTLNISFPGLDSEAVMLVLKQDLAVSNGSACTSQSYTPSHVLTAMGLSTDRINGAIRLSWCHLTPDVDWEAVAKKIASLY